MKKLILFFIIALFSAGPLLAQYSPCYNAAFNEGKRLYNAGKYARAKNYFIDARGCPSSNVEEADQWIAKCNKALKDENNAKTLNPPRNPSSPKTPNPPKTAIVEIKQVDFGNETYNRDVIDEYGSLLYQSDIRYLTPLITYDGLGKEEKTLTVDVKIIKPDGTLKRGTSSPEKYTFSDSFTVKSGSDHTERLKGWGSSKGGSYTAGTYGFELWYEGKQLFSTTFDVEDDSSRPKYDRLPNSELIRMKAESRRAIAEDYYDEEDYEEAAVWYRKAAELGVAQAQNILGVMYEDGKGLEKNEVEAAKWYRKAAEQGYAWGQCNLGVLYKSGRGVEKDYQEAMIWLRKAADQGNSKAQNTIGLMYSDGLGVKEDEVEATTWYRKAAEQGYVYGQYNLGYQYEYGEGVEKNTKKAMEWYRKAADQGHEQAQKHLEKLEKASGASDPAPSPVSSITITTNGVPIVMVNVKGGTFQMGSDDINAPEDEKPKHTVTLDSYYIGETEVTQALWKAVMGNNPSHFKGDDLPVENVSWDDCQVFVSTLSQLTGMNFRLPTEAEWEFAAKGGNLSKGYKYSGSNQVELVSWCTETTYDLGTRAVKILSPNELGIYDMSGNVWEWCSDWYDSYSNNSQYNPKGPSSGERHVLRGGSWYLEEQYSRVTRRSGLISDTRDEYRGFRLCLTL